MKKKIIRLFLITLIICIVLGLCYFIHKNDFTKSTFVITQNTNTDEIHYYEVNNWKYKRNINEFESDKIEIFKVGNECYNKHADIENHIALNQLIIEKCTIKDDLENNIEINGYLEKIIKLVSKKEKHDIIGNTIIKVNDEYYVVVELNVNLWTPYKLYKYSKEKNKLKLIYTFDSEEVIGIKNK